MNDDSIDTTISALDPARHLSDDSIDELYPLERLESRIADSLGQAETDSFTVRRVPARRRPLILASAAASVVALATAFTLLSLPAGQLAATHNLTNETGRTIIGQSTGVSNDNVAQTANIYSAVIPAHEPWCRSAQISISLTDVRSSASPGSGWSGTFWFRNKGATCEMPRSDIELQPVTGSKWHDIGPGSPSDFVARSGFQLHSGSTAYANASIGPTDARAPEHSSGSIAKYCSARNATGLILTGYMFHWPNEYFKIGRPVSVCTRWYLNVSGDFLNPVVMRGR